MYKILLLKNRQPKYIRWFVFALLGFTLFLLGLQGSFLHRGLSDTWLWVSSQLGMPERLREFTTHSYPYRLINVTLCVSLVHVYFLDWKKTRIVLFLYGSIFLLCVLLVWVSKGPDQDQSMFYEIAKHLIGAMVSPFLAVFFIPALYLWNTGENRTEQKPQ